MTYPIPKELSSGLQKFLSNKQSEPKTAAQESALKVSQAKGIPVSKVIPVKTQISSNTSQQNATANMAKNVAKKDLIHHLLELPQPLRVNVMEGLSDQELNALEIALGKGTLVDSIYELAFNQLKKLCGDLIVKRQIDRIITDHPSWKSAVDSWKGIPLRDQVWLLWLYELRMLDINLLSDSGGPSADSIKLLNRRSEFEKHLADISIIDWGGKELQRCPDAIRLLVNMTSINLNDNKIKTPPDLSKNLKLKRFNMGKNLLRVAPNFTSNIHLMEIYLKDNLISTAPDLKKNGKLETLNLMENLLTEAPDVSANANLSTLYLSYNRISSLKDLSKNLKLRTLDLCSNRLTTAPKINPTITYFYLDLRQNPLTTSAKEELIKMRNSEKTIFI